MEFLELKKVKTHNLKGFDLKIPLYKLVVITGPSGSGKSSLAFDTIAEEGRRRLLQVLYYDKGSNLGSYLPGAQPFSFIPPIIGLPQGIKNWFPYKTVGEFLLLDSFLNFFFIEEGEFRCPECKKFSKVSSLNHLLKWYETLKEGTKFYFLLPLNLSSPKALEYLVSQGWIKFLIDEKEIDLSEEPIPLSFKEIYLILDRLVKEEGTYERLLEDVRQSISLNKGKVILKLLNGEMYYFNFKPNCVFCGRELINCWLNCPECKGLGYHKKTPCPSCKGLKLHPLILESKLWGLKLKDILIFTLKEFNDFIKEFPLDEGLKKGLLNKFKIIFNLGLENLKISQPVFELSIGEKKLLELLLIFSLELSHCLYILDEPSLGLDWEKRIRILEILKEIITKKNSVILVEHDPLFISSADFVIELGPQGGEKGGYLLKAGKFSGFSKEFSKIKPPLRFEKFEKLSLKWEEKNLSLIKGGINLIYGKTGSQKTKFFKKLFEKLKKEGHTLLEAGEELVLRRKEDLIMTYTGLWQDLREVLIQLPSAKVKGLTKNYFSFSTKEGVCRVCKGKGKKIWEEENFNLKVICEECLGKKLNSEVLNLEYKGFKVAEIFDLTVKEALEVFSSLFKVKKKLELMEALGLNYLKLGQELESLSGGEISRLSMVKELAKKDEIDYIFLSFPFQGLHLKDIETFLKFLENFLKRKTTVIILETNPFSFFVSHWMIEIEKGKIKFQGLPEEWFKTLKNEERRKIIEIYGKFFFTFKN